MAETAKATMFSRVFNVESFNYSTDISIVRSDVIENEVTYFISNSIGLYNSVNSFRDILSRMGAFKTT